MRSSLAAVIGVFDSGSGGLSVLRALAARFPRQAFVYLGDHANAPYGERPSQEIVELSRRGALRLFGLGARLVVLGCNTATAVALRTLQRDWLPHAGLAGRNVIGIVAPTVEAATQTPWAVTTPQYPQKNNRECIAVFGTTRTVESGVYVEEIRKRCPQAGVSAAGLPGAGGRDRGGAPRARSSTRSSPRPCRRCWRSPAGARRIARSSAARTSRSSSPCSGAGCPRARASSRSRRASPTASRTTWRATRDYADTNSTPGVRLLTTGAVAQATRVASIFWPDAPPFERFGDVRQQVKLLRSE